MEMLGVDLLRTRGEEVRRERESQKKCKNEVLDYQEEHGEPIRFKETDGEKNTTSLSLFMEAHGLEGNMDREMD